MADLTTSSPATRFVARFLRIPHDPEPPAGAHDSVRTFRAAKAYYRYRLVGWALTHLTTAIGLAIGIVALGAAPPFPYKFVVNVVEALVVAFYLAAFALSYLMVHLDYQLRWYIVTDRSLRIREGLVSINEKTMSFANIQNISVRQGPLQRAFGIADVEVRTAGGGAAHAAQETARADLHLGYFRGVDNAEEIRDAILARVRQMKDSGLGDLDVPHEAHQIGAGASASEGAVEAARELLDEMRGLRAITENR